MSGQCRRSKRTKRATDFLTYEEDDEDEQQHPKKALKSSKETTKKPMKIVHLDESSDDELNVVADDKSLATKKEAPTLAKGAPTPSRRPVKTNANTTEQSKPNDILKKFTKDATTKTSDTALLNISNKLDPASRIGPTTATKLKPEPTAAPFAAVIAKNPAPAYESDEEPPQKDPKDFLDWRDDPEMTFSDWKIEIVSGTSVDTYHVHKVMLSYGFRNQNESGYFLNLFCRGDRYPESSSNTSRIELDKLAAKAFPLLLDYVYATGGKETLDASTETASALYFLGSYFDMRRLRWEAKQFWKKDLCLKNAASYYEHARVFREDKILDSVADLLAENILEIEPSSTIMDVSDASLWISILEKLKAKAERQLHLGQLIAAFVVKNVDELDGDTFRRLTAAEMLPTLSTKAALTLLEMEIKFDSKSPSLLEDRCATSIAANWSDISNMIHSDTRMFKKKMRRSFLTKLLEKSLDNATGDLENMTNAKKATEIKLTNEKKDTEIKLEESNRKLKAEKESSAQYSRWWREEDEEKLKIQAQLNSAQVEIAKLRSLVPSFLLTKNSNTDK